MPKFPLAGALLALTLASLAQAEPVSIDGVGLTRDVPCQGQDVEITGSANHIRLTGTCGAVTVYGSDHQVSLEQGGALSVSGIQNQVTAGRVERLEVDTAKNRVQAALEGRAPNHAQLEVSGADHILELVFKGPAVVNLSGADNQLRWSGSEPLMTVQGVDNRIERQP
ncbi:DUF3060 domain-containing protein [Pseudomonas otitidis]|uniref:DUF3060 domain-containing protein n=1 Tax=Metapseudomonas otitidis TaxID=319939 RepID=A0A7X3HBW0_9GAMM|nr:DUF3060 domain-containing protein [Pseudomonas otitidis]MWK59126.1 DUF3060 domain-containing protein [Pseudomonas otitidis]